MRFSERGCQVVLGGAAQRAAQYENSCFFTVCNYEQVLRDILAVERAGWDLIVLDEGQRIKNWEAKTTQTMKSLRSPFALVLSGTPLENRLDDLFSVAEFIDDRRLGPAFRFFNRHRVTDEKGKVLGYKNLERLRESLKPIMLRRTRSAVMRDLPPRTTEMVRIPPTGEQLDIDGAQMKIVSQIVRKPYISEMDGSIPQKKRQQLVHQFQRDPACRLFITTNAGSTGLNLQAANTVINVDLPWNPAVLEQRIGRAHRMGQKNPVQVYVLVTEETIEEKLLATLSAKHDLALATLDMESDVKEVALSSGIEELKQRLEVLLGAKAHAAVDETEKQRQRQEAERLARRSRVAEAGGQLLTAAFTLLGEMIPQRVPTNGGAQMASELKARLEECLERDEQGRPRLTVTLPNEAALENLAQSMAALLTARDR